MSKGWGLAEGNEGLVLGLGNRAFLSRYGSSSNISSKCKELRVPQYHKDGGHAIIMVVIITVDTQSLTQRLDHCGHSILGQMINNGGKHIKTHFSSAC